MEKNKTLKTIVYTKKSGLETYVGRYRFSFNGKEKDDEAKGAGNSVDYGDRIYDPRLGRWTATDPRFREYVPVSPYAFGLNNPIVFKDADGNVIVDGAGNSITYAKDRKTGQITWSPNATADVMKLGNAMLKTDKGVEVFDKMIQSNGKVHVEISNDISIQTSSRTLAPVGVEYGTTAPVSDNVVKENDGTPIYEEAKITIYIGSFEFGKGDDSKLPVGTKRSDIPVKHPDKLYKGSEEEFLNGVGTHEGIHFLTNVAEYNKNPKAYDKGKKSLETKPMQEEDISREQFNEASRK